MEAIVPTTTIMNAADDSERVHARAFQHGADQHREQRPGRGR